MDEYTTHCSECGTPLTEDEVAYSETGSLVTDPVDLCEYCSKGYKTDLALDELHDFLDEVDFLMNGDENEY